MMNERLALKATLPGDAEAPDERTVERAENIVCAFARVRVQPQADAAANLSEAIYSLQAAVGANAPRLPVELRDRLINEIRVAAPIIQDVFSLEPTELMERCIRALFLNVEFWAMLPGERNKSRHLMTDATAHARWLRNAAHNQVLLQEINERARKRRVALVRALASAQEFCYAKRSR
ncbi:hypothetical protein [Rhizobium sp. NFR03]|uniref:hypothetical protein n=1 Tax=Rhizobium sp. NFR03 TaxID=1566263 RepID=UPI0008B96C8C|nr:hypothetical protein [Rhizobium sp. NFR03]SES44317.1 hypothetical protein SAMN03159406_04508 [Rhizobium sp. NFR03]